MVLKPWLTGRVDYLLAWGAFLAIFASQASVGATESPGLPLAAMALKIIIRALMKARAEPTWAIFTHSEYDGLSHTHHRK
jgi:hypothetical protein